MSEILIGNQPPAVTETKGSGDGVTVHRFAELALPGIGMKAGDVLVIDIENMEITLNGSNALDRLSDDSDPENFRIHPGTNRISFDGDPAEADIRVAWKDRWL